MEQAFDSSRASWNTRALSNVPPTQVPSNLWLKTFKRSAWKDPCPNIHGPGVEAFISAVQKLRAQVDQSTSQLQRFNALIPVTFNSTNSIEDTASHVFRAHMAFVIHMTDLLLDFISKKEVAVGQKVYSLVGLGFLSAVWTPVLPQSKQRTLFKELTNLQNSLNAFVMNVNPIIVQHAIDSTLHVHRDDWSSRHELMMSQLLASRMKIIKPIAFRNPAPTTNHRDLDLLMHQLGLDNEKPSRHPPKMKKPKKKAKQKPVSRQNHIVATNDLARIIDEPQPIPAPELVQHSESNMDGGWEKVVVKKIADFMLQSLIEKYYNISKMHHFQNYTRPVFDKKQGKVVVYARTGDPTHVSISPQNLPDGFHITDTSVPGTRRWYADKNGRILYSTTKSKANHIQSVPDNVQMLAQHFAKFLAAARR